MKLLIILSFAILFTSTTRATTADRRKKKARVVLTHKQKQERMLADSLSVYFKNYTTPSFKPRRPASIDSVRLDFNQKEVHIYPTENFFGQTLELQQIELISSALTDYLPIQYSDYKIKLFGKYAQPIEELVPNFARTSDIDSTRLWNHLNYSGEPWVQHLSRPYSITKGLYNRHLAVTPSHGRFYRNKRNQWEWQRPYLFTTAEDLLTQSIVLPYLYPMLENAGAYIINLRERDKQTECIIVDNDTPNSASHYLEETSSNQSWSTISAGNAFAMPNLPIEDNINPFKLGTARSIVSTADIENLATAKWIPKFPKTDEYAVYVSYSSLPNSTDQAIYTVKHLGGESKVAVNQRIGGNTWVYIGTYKFREGVDESQGVELSNYSATESIITADAVRFGGGMGKNMRGNSTSNLPAYLEAARYYCQWAGLPTELYNTEKSENDYVDDLRCRSNFINYLAGGSVYAPDTCGLHVPIELSLAVHTDAGIKPDHSVFGTLSISTNHIEKKLEQLQSGISRMASHDFAQLLAKNLTSDLSATLGIEWSRRETWNRNYSETRVPLIPSAIIELLSHQNFTDMRYAHDPHVKFAIARSLYKSILQYVNYQHGITDYQVQPLPVNTFAAQFIDEKGCVRLTWEPTIDILEPSAQPTGYVVYTRKGARDFDNGVFVHTNEYEVNIESDEQYSFKVVAVNDGGSSFPSETLAVYHSSTPNAPEVLIVNGFTRLSGPALIMQGDSLGFDLNEDAGVPYLYNSSYCGPQICFDTLYAGKEGPGALGFSSEEWIGQEIAGNTFDFPSEHGYAMHGMPVSYASCSRDAVEKGNILLNDFAVVDLILGAQRDVPHNIKSAKTFSPNLCDRLSTYLYNGGALFVSGNHLGADMTSPEEQTFLNEQLKLQFVGKENVDSIGCLTGLNLQIPLYNAHSSIHYPVVRPDALAPTHPEAFTAFIYPNGVSAGIAYPGSDYRVISLGVPFECISDKEIQRTSMHAILQFLLER